MIYPPAAFLYLNEGRPFSGLELNRYLSLLYTSLSSTDCYSRRIGCGRHLFPG